MGNTPFALAYGMGAIIPTKIGMLTARTVMQGQRSEQQELTKHLDWTDEIRESASIQMATYQQKAIAYYNRKVQPRTFKVGTLVLRKVFENKTKRRAEKLQANWENPYIVSKANENGAYHLQTVDETPLLCPWNVANLKQYYQQKRKKESKANAIFMIHMCQKLSLQRMQPGHSVAKVHNKNKKFT